MIIVMLIAGIGCLLAGLLAIGFGIPVKEFSFGNTLILSGAVGACTGLIILGLSVVVRELKKIAGRLGPGTASDWPGTAVQPAPALSAPVSHGGEGGPLMNREQFSADYPGAEAGAPGPAPWLEEAAARDRNRSEAPETAEPAAKPRRNLMFSSVSRRERGRVQARGDQSAPDHRPAPAAEAPASEPSEVPPATFDDAWPRAERQRSSDTAPQRRAARTPSLLEATSGATSADRKQPPAGPLPPVTVLKSGVVDGMAYSLYSDGSIEAQLPEGMMRFASIDELRAHLDQRT